MIKIDQLSYSFPQKELFDKISFTLEEGRHCAFIGTSGSGKSTLVDILMNPDQYLFEGKIEINPDCRIGYVSQFGKLEDRKELTVSDYIGEAYTKLQTKITDLCTEMETATDLEPLLEKYQLALDAFQAIGGDDFESNRDKKLNLANLKKHENLDLSKLSGGEFKLIQVIKEMLTEPDLLIMDEPDVFLDFENLNSLKNLINAHKGTILLITHNRYLLDHCFDKIIHLENKELQEFDGRYLDYRFALLQSKIELQELAAADEEEIKRNEQIIDRLRTVATVFTDAARGKALHARVKYLERLEARKIKAPFVWIREPAISFHAEQVQVDTTAIKVEDYHLAFEEVLLDHVSFELKATDKVALVGPNGTGKTTLLRELFQNNQGSIHLHPEIKMALLSQNQSETLTESNSICDEFLQAGFQTYDEVRSYILSFGFEEEALNQKIALLSGGEKNLLQLAKISAGTANLLLLDEPTSHLDIYSQIALETAIKNYNGAILMISHDFYSIANSMDYVLYIEDKQIRKMSIRKFRKMIYADHFSKEYLELEQKKKELELRVELALKDMDFSRARTISEELEALIKLL